MLSFSSCQFLLCTGSHPYAYKDSMLLFLKINTFPRAHSPFQTAFFPASLFLQTYSQVGSISFLCLLISLLTHSNWPFHPSIPLKVLPLCPIHSLRSLSHLAQPSAAPDATRHLSYWNIIFSSPGFGMTSLLQISLWLSSLSQASLQHLRIPGQDITLPSSLPSCASKVIFTYPGAPVY